MFTSYPSLKYFNASSLPVRLNSLIWHRRPCMLCFWGSLLNVISHVKFYESSVIRNSHFRAFFFYRLFSPPRKYSPVIPRPLPLIVLPHSGSPGKSGLGTANYTTSWHPTCCGATAFSFLFHSRELWPHCLKVFVELIQVSTGDTCGPESTS